jgi:hypothetical protein
MHFLQIKWKKHGLGPYFWIAKQTVSYLHLKVWIFSQRLRNSIVMAKLTFQCPKKLQ